MKQYVGNYREIIVVDIINLTKNMQEKFVVIYDRHEINHGKRNERYKISKVIEHSKTSIW